MGQTTGISWCHHTFNPWIGCTKISPGCEHCYAETQNNLHKWNPAGWGPGAPRKRTSPNNWAQPIKWAKQAVKDGVIRRVFCASLADVFDPDVPQEWRDDLWKLIETTQSIGGLEWLILTKRPENISKFIPLYYSYFFFYPDTRVRIGVTVENQEMAGLRIHTLFRAWQGKNFVSYEPALGPLNLRNIRPHGYEHRQNDALAGVTVYENSLRGAAFQDMPKIDWVICGGESGPGCRPMDLEWARDVRDQCASTNVPFFFKQIGGHPERRGDPTQWPEDLRIQQFPEG